ncbi:MAG TPA: hypothetical protein VH596_14865 [Terriglobales bacterium]
MRNFLLGALTGVVLLLAGGVASYLRIGWPKRGATLRLLDGEFGLQQEVVRDSVFLRVLCA